MDIKKINYSQCWEDVDILREVFNIGQNDNVLSVTSGGDNTLALLLDNPHKIVSIDINPVQNYLLEAKFVASTRLDYQEYIEFVGVVNSKRRLELFKKIEDGLSADCKDWWLEHKNFINVGLINCGRFERFTIYFAQKILPLVCGKDIIESFVNTNSIEEQTYLYYKNFDSFLWRALFNIFSSKFVLSRYARQSGMMNGKISLGNSVYLSRLVGHIKRVPIVGNFYLHFSLMGRYLEFLPSYLQYSGYEKLRSLKSGIVSIVTSELLSYLMTVPDNHFDKYNLSDIFEALSDQENDRLWEEIVRTSKNGATVVFWNNLVDRSYPAYLSSHVQTDLSLNERMRSKDRVFFYDSIHIHNISK